MDDIKDKHVKTEDLLECPIGLLTDVGSYCYVAVTSVALNMLYGDEEASHDREFVESTIKCLTSHLNQPQRVCDAALMMAHSVEITHYQPFIDSLKNEDVVQAHGIMLIPKDMVIVGLKEGGYDARMRSLIKCVSLMLNVDWLQMEEYEDFVVNTFKEQEHVASEEENKEKESKAKVRKFKKYALIGAATVGGGVLVGLTGGLAAPFIAAGAGAIIGGAGAAALGSTAGIAIIGSLFGVAGAGLGGFKMNKRVGDVEEFTFEPLTEGSRLHVTVAITGWITEECPDFAFAWRGLDNSKEQYVLRYESKYLKQMGSAMDYLVSMAVSQATAEALKYTVLSGLMAAIVWPAAIIAAAGVIDNPWSVLTNRTEQAGKMLAEVLLKRQQGRRPVTLIGFSLGARVIYYCLQEMAKRKNCEGIIEDAIMLGTPAPANPKDWQKLKRVVAGKILNGYCRGDWLLKFLYRTASVQFRIAGLEPIKWTDRRMQNLDLSEIVEGHMDYMNKLDQILDIAGIKIKPHATGGTSSNLKDWVSANKQRKTNKNPTVMAASQSANLILDAADIEMGEDIAKSTLNHASTDPNIRHIKENDQLYNDTMSINSVQQTDYSDTCNRVDESMSDVEMLASVLVSNAVSQAKDKFYCETASPTTSGISDNEELTEVSSNSDLLKLTFLCNSFPSFDSGIGPSVAQADESLVEGQESNNMQPVIERASEMEAEKLCTNFNDIKISINNNTASGIQTNDLQYVQASLLENDIEMMSSDTTETGNLVTEENKV